MEKRILGILLSVLGITGLVYAGIVFMNGGDNIVKPLIFSAVLGTIFFLAGISLVRSTKDKPT